MAIQKSEKIWFDGKFVNWDDAKIHVLSHVVHYGSSAFEGFRCYDTKRGPACFRLGDHIDRLFRSAKIYRMEIPYTKEEVEDFRESEVGAQPNQATAPQAVAPDAVQEIVTQASAEATPFDEPDYTICPVKGCEYTGKKWEELETAALQQALTLENMGVTAKYKAEIDKVIKQRGQ